MDRIRAYFFPTHEEIVGLRCLAEAGILGDPTAHVGGFLGNPRFDLRRWAQHLRFGGSRRRRTI